MSPSFIRNSRENIGVVLVKYKNIKLPAVFNNNAEVVSVKKNYNLDENFYPMKSEIDKGMKCALDQISHCMSKCIAGLVRFDSDLKWPEKEGRERINKFIRKTEVGKLVLEVNGEITSRK